MRTRVLALVAIIVLLLASGVVVFVLTRPDFGLPPGVDGNPAGWADLLYPLSWTVTGVVLILLQPSNRVGHLMIFVGLCQALAQASQAYGMYGVGIASPEWSGARWIAEFGSPLWIPGLLPLVTLLPAIYPDGHLPSPRWRAPFLVTAFGIGLVTFAMVGAYDDIALGQPPVPMPDSLALHVAVGILMVVCFVGGAVTLWVMTFARLVRLDSPERQQLAWLVCAVLPAVLMMVFAPWDLPPVLSASIPVAIAVGVLRYGMLGIELVLRRGLVYAALTGAVVAVYLLVAALVGSRITSNPGAGVLTAAVIAVGLTPLRDRLQRGVDRLVYGERRDPMKAVLQVGETVAGSHEADELVPTVLETVATAVRSPGASLETVDGHVIASVGTQAPGARISLLVGGVGLGTLVVAERTPGEKFTEIDLRLLNALAQQVAVVLRAQDLTEALEAERDRVVTATSFERNRLRRELHDGLGPSLSGLGLGLSAVESAVDRGDEETVRLIVGRLRSEAALAVSEVRRILDDLRPTALDAQDFPSAIRRYADQVSTTIPVMVLVDGAMVQLNPDLEVAAYRIAQEALTNAARHSAAAQITLNVDSSSGCLVVEVADDGHGFGDGRRGVGLESMRQRAEGIGGTLQVTSGPTGTTVLASLPLEPMAGSTQ